MRFFARELFSLLPIAVLSAPAFATQYVSVEEAKKILFPNSTEFVAENLKLDSELRDEIKKSAGTRQRSAEQVVFKAIQKGKTLGWVIIDDVVGKHEFITYAAGIDLDGKVVGVEVLEYRETHGGQIRDVSWRKKFAGKKLGDPFQLDVDVPNISGATLSCRNVLDGVKRLLVIHRLVLAKTLVP